jgi:alkylation response protein AidB-like acyl-CoA dehydrogenase
MNSTGLAWFSARPVRQPPARGQRVKAILSPDQLRFLTELRAYLDTLDPELVEATRGENIDDPMQPREQGRRFLRRLGSDGWLGVSWPREYGGRGLTAIEQWLFAEELYNRRLPNGLLTLNAIGPVLIRLGSDQQKAEYLPRILAGDLEFAIGYSEPDAGSDLASLRTRAFRENGEYIVNGQKIWTTGASVATHLWLAVRTGTPDSRHRGVSLLITPIDAPGITINPIVTQGGERTNAVFLDDVRIPASGLVGAENEGWAAITAALNFERMFYHNEPRWELRQLTEWAEQAGLLDGDTAEAHAVQATVGELAVDVEICRMFAMRGARMLAEGRVPYAEASMNKIWWGELRQRICNLGLDLIGEDGAVAYGSEYAPAHGHLERGLRSSPVWRFGGGTNEIQLDIIATRGLGMAR